ncbi:MAG: ABC transporter permease [Flavobacteriia bacterium]|nr:ABC transporter permease [Flavobacteriia bacterium]
MFKIIRYSFLDILKSKLMLIYTAFFLLIGFGLLNFSSDLHKAIISMMNILLLLVPLISTVFGVMYFYNSREFVELLMCQPIERKDVFLGLYFGVSLSLSISLFVGTLIPFMFYGLSVSGQIFQFFNLMLIGVLLTFIFSILSFLISVYNKDKIKGFGYAILLLLYLSVIYDGMMLMVFVSFSDYPLENVALALSILNPIDLGRIAIVLKLDVAALMGYTGAVFNAFLGSMNGILLSIGSMALWFFVPLFFYVKKINKRDF